MKRRFIAVAACTGLLVLSACGGGSGSADSNEASNPTVKISTFGANLPDVAYLVGIDRGFFKKHKVNVEAISFAAVPAATAALKSGDLDLVGSTGLNQAVANNAAAGSSGKLVNVVAYHPAGLWQLFAGPKLKSPDGADLKQRIQALKGAKLGVPALGSEGQLVAASLLRWAGMNPDKDVTFIATGLGAEAVASFKTGQIDAVVHAPPYTQLLVDLGGKLIFDMTKSTEVSFLSPWLIATYLSTKSAADKNSVALKRFQSGLKEAIAFIHDPANTDKVAEIWAEHNKVVPKATLAATIAADRENFSTDYDCLALKNVQEFAVSNGLVKQENVQPCESLVWSGASQFIKK